MVKSCPVCHIDHERQGIYCSRKCGKRVWNAKARGTTPRAPVGPFDCAQCGQRCVPGENVAAHASRFCGRECKGAWHWANEDGATRRHYARVHELRVAHIHPMPAPDPLAWHELRDGEAYAAAMSRDPCAYCPAPASLADHIEPTARGGLNEWENLTGACHRCNGRKSATPLLLFLAWDRAERAFAPWRAAVGELYV